MSHRGTWTLLAALALAGWSSAAAAHPHVWIEAKADIVFDDEGRVTAVRHAWRFDDAYSAFASQGLDTDGDGKLSQEELKPLADVNVESMKDFAYFTFMAAGDRDIDFSTPTEYWLTYDDGLLTLYFTLPTAEPVEVRSLPAEVEVYDPTYFVDFAFVETEGVTLANAPQGCGFEVIRPAALDPSVAAALAEIGPEQRELPPELAPQVSSQQNEVKLSCP